MAQFVWVGGTVGITGLGYYEDPTQWNDITAGGIGLGFPQPGDTAEIIGNAVSGVITNEGAIIVYPVGGHPVVYAFPAQDSGTLLNDPNALVGDTIADQTIDLTGVAGPIELWLEASTLMGDTVNVTGTASLQSFLDNNISGVINVGVAGQPAGWLQQVLYGVDTSGVGPTDHIPTTTLDAGTVVTIAAGSTYDVEALSGNGDPPVNLDNEGTINVTPGGLLYIDDDDDFFFLGNQHTGTTTGADNVSTFVNDGTVAIMGAAGQTTQGVLVVNTSGSGTIEVSGNGAANTSTVLVVDGDLAGQTVDVSDATVRVNDAQTANSNPGQQGYDVSGGVFVFEDANGRLELHQPPLTTLQFNSQDMLEQLPDGRMPFTTTIAGFQHGDTIDLENMDLSALTGATYQAVFAAGVLTVESPAGVQGDPPEIIASFTLDGGYQNAFVAQAGPASQELDVVYDGMACFAAGTRIATHRGDVAVEALRVGDRVRLARRPGSMHEIRWIGYRRVDCRAHPRPHEAWPVRIAADAFAPGVPMRDLMLSPEHAVFADGVLIPVQSLLNGGSIAQTRCDELVYYHVELSRHDILLAEGLATESWLDTGNRGMFANAPRPLVAALETAEQICARRACAPLVRDGAQADTVRARLAARSAELGLAVFDAIDVPVRAGGAVTVVVPAGVSRVRLVSGCGRIGRDRRLLGVLVGAAHLDGEPLAAHAFGRGFHPAENHDGRVVRWTDGGGTIVLNAAPRQRRLEVAIATTCDELTHRQAA